MDAYLVNGNFLVKCISIDIGLIFDVTKKVRICIDEFTEKFESFTDIEGLDTSYQIKLCSCGLSRILYCNPGER